MSDRTPREVFLKTARDAREYKRVLVVQLCERGDRATQVIYVEPSQHRRREARAVCRWLSRAS